MTPSGSKPEAPEIEYAQDRPSVTLRPPAGWAGLGLRELGGYRDLLYFLVWRDIKVRYKQTALGAAWAVVQPFVLMVIFSVFLGRLAGVPSEGLPYPVFAYSALVPWTLFAASLMACSETLVGNSSLVSKVYFPRLILPVAAAGSFVLDFLIAFAILVAMMAFYGITPTIRVLWVPFFALLALLVAIGVGLWFAALNVKYRDVRHAMPLLVQVWLFATPIAYPSSLVPAAWRWAYGLNPMAGVVEGFRWALLGTPVPSFGMVAVSVGVAVVALVGGLVYFRRAEQQFADLI
jgi:lipopolysaccharide transport system permease protein